MLALDSNILSAVFRGEDTTESTVQIAHRNLKASEGNT